eukprot:GHVN01085562.1.p3 GENE.GHVN01085562.1~~GHVN01085562.1.p3  ORF type:complete len:106 (-),score=14.13 GHVN01085562.1:133-450(-)
MVLVQDGVDKEAGGMRLSWLAVACVNRQGDVEAALCVMPFGVDKEAGGMGLSWLAVACVGRQGDVAALWCVTPVSVVADVQPDAPRVTGPNQVELMHHTRRGCGV